MEGRGCAARPPPAADTVMARGRGILGDTGYGWGSGSAWGGEQACPKEPHRGEPSL